MSKQKIINANCPRVACQKVGRYLKKQAKACGYNPDNVYVLKPSEAEKYGCGKFWSIVWEEGPFEWAYSLSGGASIYCCEVGTYAESPIKIWNVPGYNVECQNSYSLIFCEV